MSEYLYEINNGQQYATKLLNKIINTQFGLEGKGYQENCQVGVTTKMAQCINLRRNMANKNCTVELSRIYSPCLHEYPHITNSL